MNSISVQIRTMYAWAVRAASTLQSPFCSSSGSIGVSNWHKMVGANSTTSPVWHNSSPASVSRLRVLPLRLLLASNSSGEFFSPSVCFLVSSGWFSPSTCPWPTLRPTAKPSFPSFPILMPRNTQILTNSPPLPLYHPFRRVNDSHLRPGQIRFRYLPAAPAHISREHRAHRENLDLT
jgi:hypothetical protein